MNVIVLTPIMGGHDGISEMTRQWVRVLESRAGRDVAAIDVWSLDDRTRPDATIRSQEIAEQPNENDGASVREQSRPDAADSRYVVQLESDNAYLREQNDKKDQQLERRDRQIEAMIERDRETNILIKGLQEFIPRLPPPDRRGEEAQPMPHTDVPAETPTEG